MTGEKVIFKKINIALCSFVPTKKYVNTKFNSTDKVKIKKKHIFCSYVWFNYKNIMRWPCVAFSSLIVRKNINNFTFCLIHDPEGTSILYSPATWKTTTFITPKKSTRLKNCMRGLDNTTDDSKANKKANNSHGGEHNIFRVASKNLLARHKQYEYFTEIRAQFICFIDIAFINTRSLFGLASTLVSKITIIRYLLNCLI